MHIYIHTYNVVYSLFFLHLQWNVCAVTITFLRRTHTLILTSSPATAKEMNMCFSHAVSACVYVIISFSFWPWADPVMLSKYLLGKAFLPVRRSFSGSSSNVALFHGLGRKKKIHSLIQPPRHSQFRHLMASYEGINPWFCVCVWDEFKAFCRRGMKSQCGQGTSNRLPCRLPC